VLEFWSGSREFAAYPFLIHLGGRGFFQFCSMEASTSEETSAQEALLFSDSLKARILQFLLYHFSSILGRRLFLFVNFEVCTSFATRNVYL
jgi:hypothetical protein